MATGRGSVAASLRERYFFQLPAGTAAVDAGAVAGGGGSGGARGSRPEGALTTERAARSRTKVNRLLQQQERRNSLTR
jgi:hypothetical protein